MNDLRKRQDEHTAFIGLGSNRGDRQIFLAFGIRRLSRAAYCRIGRLSHLYASKPVALASRTPFLNMVVEVITVLSPESLLQVCREIEREAGRPPHSHKKPRVLDLDILFYDTIVQNGSELIIPHPALHTRNFMLDPLMDLCPEYVHPVYKKSISQLKKECQDTHWVVRMH